MVCMENPYAKWFEQLRTEYAEQLAEMPLPDGLPEYLQQLIEQQDEEAILCMLKLAWQFGAQVGFAAGLRQDATDIETPNSSSFQA